MQAGCPTRRARCGGAFRIVLVLVRSARRPRLAARKGIPASRGRLALRTRIMQALRATSSPIILLASRIFSLQSLANRTRLCEAVFGMGASVPMVQTDGEATYLIATWLFLRLLGL